MQHTNYASIFTKLFFITAFLGCSSEIWCMRKLLHSLPRSATASLAGQTKRALSFRAAVSKEALSTDARQQEINDNIKRHKIALYFTLPLTRTAATVAGNGIFMPVGYIVGVGLGAVTQPIIKFWAKFLSFPFDDAKLVAFSNQASELCSYAGFGITGLGITAMGIASYLSRSEDLKGKIEQLEKRKKHVCSDVLDWDTPV